MENVCVKTDSSNYFIYININFDFLTEAFKQNNLVNKKVCIVTDSNVCDLYLNELEKIIKEISFSISSFIFEAGEENKNLETVKLVYEHLLKNNFDRDSIIIALGGGVCGDLAGFVASTYMRGIKFVQVPTTLLSQVDSSVGGKVGVDFLNNKNLIGAFYQPTFVYTNISTLKTLDSVQFASGMAEVIKHGLIMNKNYLDFIINNKNAILEQNSEVLIKIIRESCNIKSEVVSKDEKETGLREILNFGHTFGHSIETLSLFKLTHGNSIAIGMLCSLVYSLNNEMINIEDFRNIKDLFSFFNLNNCLKNFNTEEIVKQMYLDKKNNNNIIKIVYLEEIGFAKTIKIKDEKTIINCINKAKKI